METERSRRSRLQFMKQFQEEEERLREERERPMRTAIAENELRQRELRLAARKCLVELPWDDTDPTLLDGIERIDPAMLSEHEVAAGFKGFAGVEDRFDFESHYQPLVDAIVLNQVYPSSGAISRIFDVLISAGLIAPKEKPQPQPAPERPKVHLKGISEDPQALREKQLRDYQEKVIAVDPRDGTTYTQYQLDNVLSADEYARIMRISRTRIG